MLIIFRFHCFAYAGSFGTKLAVKRISGSAASTFEFWRMRVSSAATSPW